MRTLLVILLVFGFGAASTAAPSVEAQRSWQFSVLLDGSPIGYHRFDLSSSESELEVRSEASFDVRFLFINAFRYRHNNRELWEGECLRVIESSTRQNGEEFAVSGERLPEGLKVEANGKSNRIDGCVMTFAYWNPLFLEQDRLLHPQTGEYMPVDVQPLGREELTVRGESVIVSAYQVKANNVDITVYYSDDNEWLGLESVAKGGRIIRYVLT
jgi:hypothetical protein